MGGRTIVVFGGSYGIGSDVVDQAREVGCEVFSFSRSSTGTYVEDPAIGGAGAGAGACRRVGHIDAVVLCAAQLAKGPLSAMDDEQVRQQIDVNYFGPVIVARASEPYLRETHGHLVLFTSSSYTRGRADYVMYSSTKAAVVNLAQALADEWSADGIHVNVINPERTRTPMRLQAFGDEPEGTLLDSEAVAADRAGRPRLRPHRSRRRRAPRDRRPHSRRGRSRRPGGGRGRGAGRGRSRGGGAEKRRTAVNRLLPTFACLTLAALYVVLLCGSIGHSLGLVFFASAALYPIDVLLERTGDERLLAGLRSDRRRSGLAVLLSQRADRGLPAAAPANCPLRPKPSWSWLSSPTTAFTRCSTASGCWCTTGRLRRIETRNLAVPGETLPPPPPLWLLSSGGTLAAAHRAGY